MIGQTLLVSLIIQWFILIVTFYPMEISLYLTERSSGQSSSLESSTRQVVHCGSSLKMEPRANYVSGGAEFGPIYIVYLCTTRTGIGWRTAETRAGQRVKVGLVCQLPIFVCPSTAIAQMTVGFRAPRPKCLSSPIRPHLIRNCLASELPLPTEPRSFTLFLFMAFCCTICPSPFASGRNRLAQSRRRSKRTTRAVWSKQEVRLARLVRPPGQHSFSLSLSLSLSLSCSFHPVHSPQVHHDRGSWRPRPRFTQRQEKKRDSLLFPSPRQSDPTAILAIFVLTLTLFGRKRACVRAHRERGEQV